MSRSKRYWKPETTQLQAVVDQSGLSVDEIAAQLGIGRSHVRNIVVGIKSPSLQTAQRMAKILGKPTDDLFPVGEALNHGN